MKLLITAPYFIPVLEQFRAELEGHGFELVVPSVEERLEEDDLLALIGDITAVIAGDDRFTEQVVAAAPHLKVINKWGTGTDSFDHDACRRRGIEITNTRDAFTVPVAESVLAYALAFARRQPWMDAAMKQGVWEKLPGHTLAESTIGIIGVGNIGSAVARRAHAFGAGILGCDPRPLSSDLRNVHGVGQVDLLELLERSDYISINCDLNSSSHHIINARTLKHVRSDAVLINTARGPCVDEVSLASALASSRLRGAALDVFEHEPLPVSSPLRTMTNVMLAPHNTNSSPRAWAHVHRNTLDNLYRALEIQGV